MAKKINMKKVSNRSKNAWVTGAIADAHMLSSYSMDYEGKKPGVQKAGKSRGLIKKYKQ